VLVRSLRPVTPDEVSRGSGRHAASTFLNAGPFAVMGYGSVRRDPAGGVAAPVGVVRVMEQTPLVPAAPGHDIAPMSDTTDDLELLLREKEELIDALTERLELTAEQLDRLQRSSGDRGHWMAGGMPAELVEQQQTLCEDLERVVQQWEDAQPTASLNRIEMQLGEIRDLVAQLSAGGGVSSGTYRDDGQARRSVATEEPSSAPASGTSAWEALKAGLMAQGGGDAPAATNSEPAAPAGPDPFETELPPAPESVDVDTANRETLRDAVLARDEYIAELLRRMRSMEGRTRPTDGWKAVEGVPEDLRGRLEGLERRLEQVLRMSEVELSLERAKLGREAARLKQLEESTQKAMERLGVAMAAQEAEEDAEDEAPHDSSPDGRWLRMLGIKREK
jgi:hypothetical protein